MRAAAEALVRLASAAIAARGRFDWVLAGGSTPRQLYALLATPVYAERIDFRRVHFFWGDERCVPPDHTDSNYRMAREALLEQIGVPSENVHRLEGELEPTLAAERYTRVLENQVARRDAAGAPIFDSVLLGMGPDGHTASLFPGTPAVAETQRWVVANLVNALGVTRLTLTLPVLNAASHVLFLVVGADKAARLREVHSGPPSAALPAGLVRPAAGGPVWLVDEPAGKLIGGLS